MKKRNYFAPIIELQSFLSDVVIMSGHDVLVGNNEFGERIFEDFFP